MLAPVIKLNQIVVIKQAHIGLIDVIQMLNTRDQLVGVGDSRRIARRVRHERIERVRIGVVIQIVCWHIIVVSEAVFENDQIIPPEAGLLLHIETSVQVDSLEQAGQLVKKKYATQVLIHVVQRAAQCQHLGHILVQTQRVCRVWQV